MTNLEELKRLAKRLLVAADITAGRLMDDECYLFLDAERAILSLIERVERAERERDEARNRLAEKYKEIAEIKRDPMFKLKEAMRERADLAEYTASEAYQRGMEDAAKALEILPSAIRLIGGELSAQEMRAVLAILRNRAQAIREKAKAGKDQPK